MGFSGIPARIVADIGTTGGLALDTSVLGVESSVDLMSAKLPATLGRQAAGASLSTAMAMEDRTTFTSILTDLDKFSFVATRLQVDAVVSSDIQIGAVEIKNATTDDRVVVRTDGVEMAMVVSQNSQPLPTGAATAANQGTEITAINAMSAKLPAALGQHAMAASLSVVVASDQVVPISATSLPLPTGAATAANQATANGSLGSIDGKLNSLGQKAMTGSMPVTIATDQTPVAVSAASLPLPTGAATSVLQTTGNSSLSSIDGKLVTTANGLKVDGSAVTQPVSGTFFQATQPVSAVSLPLPTGAATAAKQPALGVAGTPSADVITVQGAASMTALKVDGSAVTQPMSAASLPLPAGASTAANQATEIVSLASIDGKLASLGQKAMTGSVPVVLASDQSGIGPDADLTATGSISALNGSVSLSVHGCSAGLVALTGSWVANVQLQGLSPDGSTWTNLAVALAGAGTGTFSSAALTANGVYRLATTAGFSAIRATATAFTSGPITVNITASAGQATVGVISLNAANTQVTSTPVDGARATYSASIVGLATALLATDIFAITGSATKTIRVTRVALTATQTTTGSADVLLVKRSTANTAGTSTIQTAVPHDSASAAATAVVRAYTANPTLGTLVGNMFATKLVIPAPTPAGSNVPSFYPNEFFQANRPSQAIVLRGVSEQLSVNFNGVTIVGDSCDITFEWTEE